MVEVIGTLLAISLILIFGFFAEFIFKHFKIPDVLFLIVLGIVLGPNVTGYMTPSQFDAIAPLFTTFALLFLLFDGAFNIDLSSFAKGISYSLFVMLFNFIISTAIILGIMMAFGYPLTTGLLVGFILGGVSSAFVIPVLSQMNVKKDLYSILALESALTDVFCIVSALTMMELIKVQALDIQGIFAQISSLFAVAGLIGIVCGIFWIIIAHTIFKENKSYMVTISAVILVYILTEFLQGNGAIATLFFGIILRNSKQIVEIGHHVMYGHVKPHAHKHTTSVVSSSERFFYDQISFFLKVFFFVYIGLLLDLSDVGALVIGSIIGVLLMFSRCASTLITGRLEPYGRRLVNAIFARGLAAAAIVQIAVQEGVAHAQFMAKITYVVITLTIVLSSARIFLLKEERGGKKRAVSVSSKKTKRKAKKTKRKKKRK